MKYALAIFICNLTLAAAQNIAVSVADSLYATGNYTAAINDYAKNADTRSGLQIARAYAALGNLDKAVITYENVVANDQTLQISRFELGKLYHKLKRYDEARKVFTLLVSDDGNNPEYLYYQGEALRELDQIAGSLAAYKNAVAVDSTHLKSLFQLGKYFVGKQEKSEALKYIDQGLRTFSNDMALINLKALAFFNNDEFAKARPFFEKLLALGEEKPHVYAKLAYCYYREWEFEKAKKTYHRLIAIDDEDPDPYFNLAHVFLKDRQIDSARFYLKKSMAVQTPNFNREFSSLANIASGENDLKSALHYYNLAFKEEGSDYRSYYQICNIVDQTSTDPKEKLAYYEGFVEKFGTEVPYLSEIVKTRIFALKQEIHFAGNR